MSDPRIAGAVIEFAAFLVANNYDIPKDDYTKRLVSIMASLVEWSAKNDVDLQHANRNWREEA